MIGDGGMALMKSESDYNKKCLGSKPSPYAHVMLRNLDQIVTNMLLGFRGLGSGIVSNQKSDATRVYSDPSSDNFHSTLNSYPGSSCQK